jgi:hypothetical protein
MIFIQTKWKKKLEKTRLKVICGKQLQIEGVSDSKTMPLALELLFESIY